VSDLAWRLVALALAAWEGVEWLWYVSLPLFLLALGGVIWLARISRPTSRALWLLGATAFLSCLCILLFGALWYADPSVYAPERTKLPENILLVLISVVFLAHLRCVVFARSQRLAATSIAMLSLWCSYWCAFVASMSVTGMWL
jgi:hypothetical protein